MKLANDIVNEMMQHDWFSQWLGITVIEIKPGYCKQQMTITKTMLNGHQTAHGGITYSFADSALAFASNSHGYKAVSIETNIAHVAPLKEGDSIIAEATELNKSNKIARYQIKITRKNDDTLVAQFNGTVYITTKEW